MTFYTENILILRGDFPPANDVHFHPEISRNSHFLLNCRLGVRPSKRLQLLRSWFDSRYRLGTHVKRVSQRSFESRGFSVFSECSSFLPQGKLTGWVRINTVKKVISQLL